MVDPARELGDRLLEDHRVEQEQIGRNTVARLAPLWRIIEPTSVDSSATVWVDAVLPVIEDGFQESQQAADRFVRDYRQAIVPDAEPLVSVEFDDFPTERATVSVIVTGPVEVKRQLPAPDAGDKGFVSSSAAAVKIVADGGRQAVEQLVELDEEAIGYARKCDSNPCYFCAMLASRGAVYKKDSFFLANRRFKGEGVAKTHDNCQCTLRPVYKSDDSLDEDGRDAEAQEMWRIWEESTGTLSNEAERRAFRRAWENRDAPEPEGPTDVPVSTLERVRRDLLDEGFEEDSFQVRFYDRQIERFGGPTRQSAGDGSSNDTADVDRARADTEAWLAAESSYKRDVDSWLRAENDHNAARALETASQKVVSPQGWAKDDVVKITHDKWNRDWTVTKVDDDGTIHLLSDNSLAYRDTKEFTPEQAAKRVKPQVVTGGPVDVDGFPTSVDGSGIQLGDIVRIGSGAREYRVKTVRTDGTTVLTQTEGANKNRNLKPEDFAKLAKVRDDDTHGAPLPVTTENGVSTQVFETQAERMDRHQAEWMWDNSKAVRARFDRKAERDESVAFLSKHHSNYLTVMSSAGEDWKAPLAYARKMESDRGTPFEGDILTPKQKTEALAKTVGEKWFGTDFSTLTDAQLAAARREALDIGSRTATAKQHREALTEFTPSRQPLSELGAYEIERTLLHDIAVEQERRKTEILPPPAQTVAVVTATKFTEREGRQGGRAIWHDYANSLEFDQWAATRQYTGPGFKPINTGLRTDDLDPDYRDTVRNLDAVIENAPRVPEAITVSRDVDAEVLGLGADSTDVASIVGKSFKDDAYLSTSLQSQLDGVLEKKKVEIRLDVPEGIRAIYVSSHRRGEQGSLATYGPEENELILGRGIEYEVYGATVDASGRRIILARVIAQTPKELN